MFCRASAYLSLEALVDRSGQSRVDVLKSPGSLASSRALVDTNQLDPISRLTTVDQVIRQDNLDTFGQLTSRCSFRHFLDADRLIIPERGQSILHEQWMTLAVILGNHCCGSSHCGRWGDDGGIVVGSGMEFLSGIAVVDRF